MPRRPWRRWAFRGAAALLPLVAVLVVEFGLRAVKGRRPTAFLIPSADVPGALADNWRFAWRYFPRELARAPQPLLVSPQREPGVRRIVILGSSAAMGDPEPAFGVGRQVQAMLEATAPSGARVEVVNAAMTAVNSNVIRDVARDLARQTEADAWVILMGNNEFNGPFGPGSVFGAQAPPLAVVRASLAFKKSALGQWLDEQSRKAAPGARPGGPPASWRGMEMFLEQKLPPDDPRLPRVYDHFQANLEAMLDDAEARGLPVVLCTVPVNLRDCPPFASVHRGGQEPPGWARLFESGSAALAAGRAEEARTALEQAAALSPDHAETRFRLARALDGTGPTEAAARAFASARDLDALKFRSDTRLNELVRQAAVARADRARGPLSLVDAEHLLAASSRGGVPGREFFHEHVHFTFEGTFALARPVAEALRDLWKEPAASPWPASAEVAARLGWTADHEGRVLAGMRARLQKAPFNHQSNHAARQEQLGTAIRALRARLDETARAVDLAAVEDTLRAHPGDWQLRQQCAALLDSAGRTAEALDHWRLIARERPHYTHDFQLGSLLSRMKHYEEAERSLRSAVARRPDYARAWNSLGIVRSRREALDDACTHFARALALDPDLAEAHFNWGLVLLRQQNTADAAREFEAAAAREPDNAGYRYQAGHTWLQRNEPARVESHYAAVARLSPEDNAAQLNYAGLLLRLGRPAEAISIVEKELARNPDDAVARQLFERARAR